MANICPDCNREFQTIQALSTHRRSHINKNTEQMAEPNHEFTFDRAELVEAVSTAYAPTTVRIKKLPHGYNLPDLKRATTGSAAVDLYAAVDDKICVGANERTAIPTGIAVEVPEGFVAKVVPRSGLAFNHGISLVNTPGIVDSDYRGEIKVCLINHSRAKFWVNRGDRIAQMLVERVEPVEFEYTDELSNTERGTGGFGSSGR